MKHRVLLINPFWSSSEWPHYGLVLLATRLKMLQQEALVVDYNYSPNAPALADLVQTFKPDMIGFSLYTISMKESRKLIAEIRATTELPVIIGGPHASLYKEELLAQNLGDWMFTGDAEVSLIEHIDKIKREPFTVLVPSSHTDLSAVPKADFSVAWGGYSKMVYRPIQLSRGCPFSCSFCSVKCISSRKILYRDLSVCLDELQDEIRRHPRLSFVRIVDDCPTFNLGRFKTFLKGYLERGIRRPLHIDNLRGDGIDDEMLDLLKITGIDHLCIGVETGHPDVFKMVNKGVALQQIVEAALKIKSKGIRLYTCFIIGLPGSTPLTDMESIRLARRLRPDWIHWNLFQPHKGTKAQEWFEENGRLFEQEGRTSLASIDLSYTPPPCDTPEYPAADRSRMQLMAMLLTGCYMLNPFWFVRMVRTFTRFHLWKAFLQGLPFAFRVNVNVVLQRIRRKIRSKVLLTSAFLGGGLIKHSGGRQCRGPEAL